MCKVIPVYLSRLMYAQACIRHPCCCRVNKPPVFAAIPTLMTASENKILSDSIHLHELEEVLLV